MLAFLLACTWDPFESGGTAVGDTCSGEGDLRCTADGVLLVCEDGAWEEDEGCACDGQGNPECG